MKLPQFTKKDLLILATNLPVLVIFIDVMLFGRRFFTELDVFTTSFLIVAAVFLPMWFVFTWIAVSLRNKFPADKDTIKRIALTIAALASIQALLNSLFFLGFDYFHICDYQLDKTNYLLTLISFFFINVIVTLMHEGFESFEKWKATLNEAEKLKTAYARSQLMGLKSQVNPHFLFNSLNTLSSLISEDEREAEKFLNELTMVYRYFLRDKEVHLIALRNELCFMRSYFYLLKARYGEGIELRIDVNEEYLDKLIPPLTLQVIMENIFNHHSIQKDSPLKINITSLPDGWLQVENNVQKKIVTAHLQKTGLANLTDKFHLLTHESLSVVDDVTKSIVQLPLIINQSISFA